MRQFYLIASVITIVLILIASFAQLGATCVWYLFSSTAPAFLILLQMSSLGAVAGGLLVLYWKAPKNSNQGGMDEGNDE